MSKSRLVIRATLVLLILGAVTLGYRSWARSDPDYYWNQARAAIAEGDFDASNIFLRKVLQKDSEHGLAHQALAKSFREQARAAGRSGAYQANPDALNHLAEAARLLPEDIELQKQVLSIYLSMNQLQRGAGMASRVIKAEPENGDALFVLAWQAVDSKNSSRAEELFNRLAKVPTTHAFKISALILQHNDERGSAAKTQATLDRASKLAGTLTADQFQGLARNDLQALPRILLMATVRAEDVTAAHRRCDYALSALETLGQAKLRPIGDLGEQASQLMLVLDSKHPLAPEDFAGKPERARLEERAEALFAAAIQAGEAGPLVYRQLAVAQFNRGEDEAAFATLNEGLAGGPQPADEQQASDEQPATDQQTGELLELHLLAARRLIMMGRFDVAQDHIDALLAHEATAGWGHLLSGSVALDEGRLEKSLSHYLRAQKLLGNTLLVRMSLGTTYLSLGRYAESLPLLDSLHIHFESLDPEQSAWAERHLGSGAKVHFVQLQARLGMEQWEKAQTHIQALRETEFETRAYGLAVQFLWSHNRPEPAKALLADVRRRFPGDLSLFRIEVSLLQQMGQTAAVANSIASFAAATPDNLDSQLMLCQLWLQQGKAQDSLDRIENLEKRFSHSAEQRHQVAVQKGHALLALDRPQDALATIEPLRDEPRTAAAAGIIGMAAQLQIRDVEAAGNELTMARETNPGSGLLGMLEGQLAAAKGNHELAIGSFESSMDVTSLRDRAKSALVRSLLQMARTDGPAEAEAKLDSLMAKFPQDSLFILAKADLAFQQQEFDAGMELLDLYEKLDPTSSNGPYFKALGWLKKVQTKNALQELDRALALKADDQRARLLAIQVCFNTQQFTVALDHSQQLLQQNPQLWQAALLEAEALKKLARTNEAIQTLEALTLRQPKVVPGYLVLASTLAQASELRKAVEVLERGRKILPADQRLVAAEIGILVKFEQLAAAEKLADQIGRGEPGWERLFVLSQAFLAAKQMGPAWQWGERALAVADEAQQVATHLQLGNIALNESQTAESVPAEDGDSLVRARDHFEAVIRLNPNHFVAGNNLAWLLATEFDQPIEAVRVAELVRGNATVDQLPPAFVDTLAVVYRKANRLSDAERMLEQAVDVSPQPPQLVFQLGMVMAEGKRSTEARTMLEKALKLGLSDQNANEAKRQLATLGIN